MRWHQNVLWIDWEDLMFIFGFWNQFTLNTNVNLCKTRLETLGREWTLSGYLNGISQSFSSLCIILKIEKQVKLARRYKMSKVFGVAFKWLEKVCHDVSNQNPIQSQERTFIVKLGTIWKKIPSYIFTEISLDIPWIKGNLFVFVILIYIT